MEISQMQRCIEIEKKNKKLLRSRISFNFSIKNIGKYSMEEVEEGVRGEG
jgi:hypothetical protein